jgi:16S rRNA processing protein RimM
MSAERRVLLGKVLGALGLRGELKLQSFTRPREALFGYQPWILAQRGVERQLFGARGEDNGRHLVARFPGIEDRTAAEALRGAEIWILRSQLPPPQPGEYYWVDLEGLRVRNLEGVDFGVVSHLFDTGANEVLVAHGERERLIPFVQPDFVKSVDFEAGCITVDWDPDF